MTSIFISEYIPKGNENKILKRHLHFHIHCSIIHNSQDMQTTKCPSVDECIKKKPNPKHNTGYRIFEKKERRKVEGEVEKERKRFHTGLISGFRQSSQQGIRQIRCFHWIPVSSFLSERRIRLDDLQNFVCTIQLQCSALKEFFKLSSFLIVI